jgi:Flp pilus assembly protein TadG
MKLPAARLSSASRGQSLVETTLVLAAFIGLVAGIVGVGQMLFARQSMAERVHDAARWGAMHPYDPRAIRNLVLYGTPAPTRDARPFLALTSEAVEVGNPGCPGVDCRVSVAVSGQGVRSVEPCERDIEATGASVALSKP